MLPIATRNLWKRTLSWTRIKLVYTRITLTRYTTFYFFFALLNCIVLVILQGVTYADNNNAVNLIEGMLADANRKGLPVFSGRDLQMCDSIPGPDAVCVTVVPAKAKRDLAYVELYGVETELWKRVGDKGYDFKAFLASDGDSSSDSISIGSASSQSPTALDTALDLACGHTMTWLQEVLQDAKSEDLVTLAFHFWLFSLAVVTVMNESLPHLGASLAGHVMGTGWAAFRVQSTENLRLRYLSLINGGACGSVDLLGDWWEVRRLHAIPILVVSALVLFATAYLSFKLFRVYASQSFSRVGASPQTHRIYKLVLLLSVSLQLTGFFSLASTAMWIDKISHGVIRIVAVHIKIYLAAFAVTLALEIPWLILGWISVRRECRWKYVVFFGISIFLVVISTLMFMSPLYMFIFMTWPFFATITVTAYVLMVTTSVLSLWCRLNFGKGLAHFLQVSEALEGVDFTPVYFSNAAEKGALPVKLADADKAPVDEKSSADLRYLQQPELSYSAPAKPKARGESVYSDTNRMPVQLSSTPTLFKDAASLHRAKGFGGDQLDLEATMTRDDKYSQPQMPPRSAWSATTPTPSMRTRSRDLTSSPALSSSGRATPTPVRSGTPSAGMITPSVRGASPTSLNSVARPGLPAHPRRRPTDF